MNNTNAPPPTTIRSSFSAATANHDAITLPSGIAHFTSLGSASITSGSNNAATTSSPAIDFISQTASILNNGQNKFDVFSFSNTLKDALENGSLANLSLSLSQGNNLLTTLPSDWKTKYAQDPSSLNDLLTHAQELISLAHDIWTSAPSAGNAAQWFPNTSTFKTTQANPIMYNWNMQNQDPYKNYIRDSQQKNANTEKTGMADHPDYTGPVGHPDQITPDYLGEGVGIVGAARAGISAVETGYNLVTDTSAALDTGTTIAESIGSVVGIAGEEATAIGVTEGVLGGIGLATGVGEIALGVLAVGAAGVGLYNLATKGSVETGIPAVDKALNGIKDFLTSWF